MKSTEFRLKNLVWNDVQNLPCEVDFKILNDIHHGINDWKPIPLTDEWLIRFGFEKRESSTCDSWYIGTNEITHDWLFDIVWLHRPELINAPNFPFYRNGRHLIQHVHQLQNLYFALTSEELTLNHAI